MNVDGPALAPASGVPAELRTIARAGARSVRWTVYWPALQPYRAWSDVPPDRRQDFQDAGGIPTDFRATDDFVAASAGAGLAMLPVVMAAAPWIAENPYVSFSPPVDDAAFGRFAGTLAARYGSRGSFWRAHPAIPRRPVRAWQIWNEPSGSDGFASPSFFWESTRDALKIYPAMLAAARRELHAADPRARVVLSGLFSKSWRSLGQLYAAGSGGDFDVVAIHPFTRRVPDVVRILRYVRRVMKRYGDADKPLIVTELSWPSSLGRANSPYEFVVTPGEQARVLGRAYRLLARERRRLRLRAVYWFTWMTADASPQSAFDYAGLVTRRPDGGMTRKPAFRAFRRVARRLNASGRR
jgi:hypothetical protein